MPFWSDPSSDPKLRTRFVLHLGGIPQWLIKSVDKPKFNITEAKHNYLNYEFYFPARVQWQEVKVTLRDPISPDASATMRDILLASGYSFPDDPTDLSTISRAKSVEALGLVSIRQIDSDGATVEEWTLFNAWVKSVDFGDLDYDSDDIVDIELTLRYDYATLDTLNPGVPLA